MPFDLVITPSGSIAVADFQSQKITFIEPDRTVRSIGQPGQGPGEFGEVWGLRLTVPTYWLWTEGMAGFSE